MGASFRKEIFDFIESDPDSSRAARIYNSSMTVVICLSLLPLMFKESSLALDILDKACAAFFILDFAARWLTADLKFGSNSPLSFLRYPLTPMAIVDLLSILPSFLELNGGLKALRVLRLMRSLRVFRVFKLVRHSKNLAIINRVVKASKAPLCIVGAFALGYIIVSALVVFSIEPDTFDNFFEAIYWATVSLTTVGYGDIYPVSTMGRFIAMVSSVFGIAIIALPAGIITAGYMTAIEDRGEDG